jgi:hypothetical protein
MKTVRIPSCCGIGLRTVLRHTTLSRTDTKKDWSVGSYWTVVSLNRVYSLCCFGIVFV